MDKALRSFQLTALLLLSTLGYWTTCNLQGFPNVPKLFSQIFLQILPPIMQAPPAVAGYTVLHSTNCSITVSATSWPCTIPSTTAGSFLVFSPAPNFQSGQTFSCTDTASSTYTKTNYSNSAYSGVCTLFNAPSGVTSITATLGVADTGVINVLEISGVSSGIDKTSTAGSPSGIAGSTISLGPTATLANSSTLGIGVIVSPNGTGAVTLTPSGQFAGGTQQSSATCCGGNRNNAVETAPLSSTAAVTFTAVVSQSYNAGVLIVIH